MPRVLSSPFAAAAPVAVSGEVRAMNAAANVLYALAAAAALGAGLLWLMRSPLFPIRALQLEGDLVRNSVPTIRANAAPQVTGNFYSVDLQQVRQAFESVPWVRQAVVQRIWPDRLRVRLEEHRAEALWQPAEGAEAGALSDQLVNHLGEVFAANVGDVEQDDLPVLSGPSGSAKALLELHRRLLPVLAPLNQRIERLSVSGRGSWRAELDGGATLELGRGSADEVLARTALFVRTIAQVTGRFGQTLEYADLRQAGGYAVRLRGVTTQLANNKTN